MLQMPGLWGYEADSCLHKINIPEKTKESAVIAVHQEPDVEVTAETKHEGGIDFEYKTVL